MASEANCDGRDRILAFPRGASRPARPAAFRASSFLDEVRAAIGGELAAQAVELLGDVPDGLWITADRRLLNGAVLDLIRAALAAMPGGGQLTFTAVSTPRGVELEIADSGPSRAGGDVAVAQQVARLHGGSAWAANCPEGGTAVTICIPHRTVRAAA